MSLAGENTNITFRVYLYMVKEGKPVGPRDVMRGANLSSPSVAYRHLQKLTDLGLVEKDTYGSYVVKDKANVKGYVWVGRSLLPRLLLYSIFFIGILAIEIVVIGIRLTMNEPISMDLLLLTFITIIAATLLMLEGLQLKRKLLS